MIVLSFSADERKDRTQHGAVAASHFSPGLPWVCRTSSLRARSYAEGVRMGARAGVVGVLASLGLLSLGELAGQLLLGDPLTPQRLAALAVAVLAAVAAGCVAAAVRVDRVVAAVPVVRRVTALRDKSWRVAFLRLRDPGARGRSRPRAPSAAPAAA
jgi:hypothetical protein